MPGLSLPGLLGGASNPIGAASTVFSAIGSLFGGKPDQRPAREDELFAMVQHQEPYALEAARIIWWRHSSPGSKADAAENAVVWSRMISDFPALAQAAMAAGPLKDTTSDAPHVPPTGSYSPGAFNSTAASNYANALDVVGSGVQQIGASLTNRATNAINPNAQAVTIPTNMTTLVLLGAGLLLVAVLVLRGRR
jgi:hypothetical protein